MKPKKLEKKLVLNKATIVNLKVKELQAIYAGQLPDAEETKNPTNPCGTCGSCQTGICGCTVIE